jgi:hypothetical protein
MSFPSSDQNPEPSKERAILSFITGIALMGSGAAAGIAMGRRYDRETSPAHTRSDRITMTVGMLLVYAGLGLGITIGWRRTHSFWGPFAGSLLGMFAGLLLMLLLVGFASLVKRRRSRGQS